MPHLGEHEPLAKRAVGKNNAAEELFELVEELLELAEELITYPSSYFLEKWDFRKRLDNLRSRFTLVTKANEHIAEPQDIASNPLETGHGIN